MSLHSGAAPVALAVWVHAGGCLRAEVEGLGESGRGPPIFWEEASRDRLWEVLGKGWESHREEEGRAVRARLSCWGWGYWLAGACG